MLKLEYIVIGELPERQESYLNENLSADGSPRGRIVKLCDGESEDGGKLNYNYVFEAVLPSYCLPQECLLISGNDAQLAWAGRLNMASIAYLSPEKLGECEASQTAGRQEDGCRSDLYAEGFEEVDWTFLRRVYERHHGIPWLICETERCVIKEFSMEYLDELFAMYAGERMTDYIEPLYDYEEEREYQQAYISRVYPFYGYGMWIVCEKKTGRLIGRAGVEMREELEGELELGYAVGVPYQRQGYAAEVCAAIISYVKKELGQDRLNCLIEEGNTVSEHFAKRLGFSFLECLTIEKKRMKRYVLALTQTDE